jgi:hypothetical protein
VTLGPYGVPAFKVGIDHPVFGRYHHPTWFASPRWGGDQL